MTLMVWERAERAAARKVMRCVERGAAFLDVALPGWYDVLDLRAFDISDPTQCVIGQLAQRDMAAFYAQAQAELGSKDYEWGISALSRTRYVPYTVNRVRWERWSKRVSWWAGRHGFEVPVDRGVKTLLNGWAALQEAWVLAIAVRRRVDPARLAHAESRTVNRYDITFENGLLHDLPSVRWPAITEDPAAVAAIIAANEEAQRG